MLSLPYSSCCWLSLSPSCPSCLSCPIIFSYFYRRFYFFSFQLAKDLLLPLAKNEQRKHKLKRLVQVKKIFPKYSFSTFCPKIRKLAKLFTASKLLLHGRQMPGMLQNHHRELSIIFIELCFPQFLSNICSRLINCLSRAIIISHTHFIISHYRFSLTRRPLLSARDAPLFSASQLVEEPGSLKVRLAPRIYLKMKGKEGLGTS